MLSFVVTNTFAQHFGVTLVGVVTVDGGYIKFTPGINCAGVRVFIPYQIDCEVQTDTAELAVDVSRYNKPANIIDEDHKVECR